jgi:azurin
MNRSFEIIVGIVLTIAFFSSAHPSAESKTIYLKGFDRLEYSVNRIEVKAGEQIDLTLETISDLPATQMAHNWVLLKKDSNPRSFINEGMDDKTNEYIDPGFEDQIIASTKMLAGGQKETIQFKAPDEKGEYIYVCTFPGHYQAGMKGRLIVK